MSAGIARMAEMGLEASVVAPAVLLATPGSAAVECDRAASLVVG